MLRRKTFYILSVYTLIAHELIAMEHDHDEKPSTVVTVLKGVDTALGATGHRNTGTFLTQGNHRTPSEWWNQGNHRSVSEFLSGEPSRNSRNTKK